MRIAYVGEKWGTSLHRAQALERVGHKVVVIDPRSLIPKSIHIARWLHHTGGLGFAWKIEQELLDQIWSYSPELVWVNQGELVRPRLLQTLRARGVKLVNYINDDPFRPGQRFRLYRKAIPIYDLLAVLREPNVAEAKAAGARKVLRVWMTADEIVHQRVEISDENRARYASDVCFIGTWMPERGPFMAELIRRGVPLSIWGDNWHKAREWSEIKQHWRGPGIYNDHYAIAIMMSKICLGLLSKGNRDLHTRRSIEIPALGALLCAERTSEHLQLYKDGEEAVFWSDAEECAAVCNELLRDDVRRNQIAISGERRVSKDKHFNEDLVSKILQAAYA